MDPAVLAVGSPRLEEITGLKLREFLSDPQGLNNYAYVKNNPLRSIDPNGENTWDLITGKQSWDDYVIEIGEGAEQLYNDSETARFIMDHPIITGLIVGVGGGLAAYGIVTALSAIGVIAPTIEALTTQQIIQKTTDKINQQTKNAYEVARSGGKHADFIKNVIKQNQTIENLTKSYNSFSAKVTEHLNYISNPQSKISDWNQWSAKAQQIQIENWYKHALKAQELANVTYGIIKEMIK